jgi:hypothetical protein
MTDFTLPSPAHTRLRPAADPAWAAEDGVRVFTSGPGRVTLQVRATGTTSFHGRTVRQSYSSATLTSAEVAKLLDMLTEAADESL